jgi:hypothetical protein
MSPEGLVIAGEGLKIGGQGMRTFYDKLLPNLTNKYIKKWGAKVGKVDVSANAQHGFDITDQMRESAMEGQPQFSRKSKSGMNFTITGDAGGSNGAGNYTKNDSTGFAIPDDTWKNVAIRKFQDKYKVLKDLQTSIEDNGGQISEAANTYVAEELFHGKAENDIKEMQERFVEPLAKMLGDFEITQAELDLYLYANHAEERNRHVATIRPDRPDGGSGMTDKEARKIKAEIAASGQQADYDKLAGIVYAMLQRERDILKEGNLSTEQSIDEWESNYKHYVPLKGFTDEETGFAKPKTGRGFSIGGKESIRAMGRFSRAASPSSFAIIDLTEKLVRVRKNEVGNSLRQLILDNPSPDWHVYSESNPEMKESIVEEATDDSKEARKKARSEALKKINANMPEGMTVEEKKEYRSKEMKKVVMPKMEYRQIVKATKIPMAMMSRDYFTTKINGVTYYMKMDERLMKAMKNLGINDSNVVIQSMGSATRLMSALNTSYNPEFIVGNLLRDVQTALHNLNAEQTIEGGKIQGEEIVKQTALDVPIAMRAAFNSLRGKKMKSKEGQEFQKWFEEFKAAGAKTGWFDMKDLDGQRKEIESLVSMKADGTKAAAKRGVKSIANFVENANSAVENAVRLAAYVNARRVDISPQVAASLAKNMTVNFNRKGEMGATMNALFMFSNASIQGVANFARAMGTLNGDKSLKWKNLNRAQKVAVGMVAGSFFLAMFNRAGSGEDDDGKNWFDKVPDYIKERNIVIMKEWFTGEEKTYWTIPLPYGYNIFNILGDSMESMLYSGKPLSNTASRLVLGALGSFSPIGYQDSKEVSKGVIRNITPTLFKPLTDIAANENFFGSTIYNENKGYGVDSPDSSMGRRSTPEAYRSLATWLNEATDGNQYQEGGIDINPDTMRYVVDFFGGGAYKFWGSKLPNTIHRGLNDVDIEVNQMPFISRVSGKVMHYNDQSEYYINRKEILQAVKARKNLKGKAKLEQYKKDRHIINLAIGLKNSERRLKAIRKDRDRIYDNKLLSFSQRDLKLKGIQVRMKREFDKANKKFSIAKKK